MLSLRVLYTVNKDMASVLKEILFNEYDGNRSSFAKDIGFSPQIVSQWLKGYRSPSPEAWEAIAKRFEVSVEYLQSGRMYDYKSSAEPPPQEAENKRIEAAIIRATRAAFAGKEIYLEEPAAWLLTIKRLLEEEDEVTKDICIEAIRSTLSSVKAARKKASFNQS